MEKIEKLEYGHRLDDENLLIKSKKLHESHIKLNKPSKLLED